MYGGDRQHYDGFTAAKTSEMTTHKIHLASTVSKGHQFSSVDIKDFYLTAHLPRPRATGVLLSLLTYVQRIEHREG